MERYLEGEEISHEETVAALKTGVTEGQLFPVTCGAATRNLGINRLLDAFVEYLPSPAKRGTIDLDGVDARAGRVERTTGRVRLQDARRPICRAAEPVPRLPASSGAINSICDTCTSLDCKFSGAGDCWGRNV